ncbi:MAG: lipid-A-disaccharide synthase [Alphaproteobacteria bacterium]|nr:lipid-A-disaccharide synthase [Alphaproteobacteria bacterium]
MVVIAPKVFLIAGEASGDVLGSQLMESLKASQAQFMGVGGPLMEEQGLDSLMPMHELCVMGIWEVVVQLPRLIKLINGVVEEIERAQPDIVVTIDLPDFNFQVAKRLKKRGIYTGKFVHYVAPSVWAWRPGRAKKIAQFLDGIMCLFPFEPEYFEKHGLPSKYVGHPIIRQDHKKENMAFREAYDIKADDFVFGLYLGSRESEISRHKDVFKDAVNFILEQKPDVQILLPTLEGLELEAYQSMRGLNVTPIIVSNAKDKWAAMRNCDLAMAVSGTVGLELAYMNVPHVIAYKTHFLTFLAVRLLVKVRFAHLVNILLDKAVVPEFLQSQCKSLLIAAELMRLISDPAVMAQQKVAFHDARRILKKDVAENPAASAAGFVLDILNKPDQL